jgi:F0F1-type ATP synthase assembly protein I
MTNLGVGQSQHAGGEINKGLTAGGGMVLGMIFGIIFDHLALGMIFGLFCGAAAAARRSRAVTLSERRDT